MLLFIINPDKECANVSPHFHNHVEPAMPLYFTFSNKAVDSALSQLNTAKRQSNLRLPLFLRKLLRVITPRPLYVCCRLQLLTHNL